MTADSTNTPKNAKPSSIEETYSCLSRASLEQECLSNWIALSRVAGLFNGLNDGDFDEVGFADRVHEIVCEGMGFCIGSRKPPQDNVHMLFPRGNQGDVA